MFSTLRLSRDVVPRLIDSGSQRGIRNLLFRLNRHQFRFQIYVDLVHTIDLVQFFGDGTNAMLATDIGNSVYMY